MVPFPVLHTLYNSIILPHLTYCITVWGITFHTHLNQLVTMQKKSIRIIFNKSYLEHTGPLFAQAKILKIQDLYKYHTIIHFYKKENRSRFSHRHNYLTRNRQNFIPPLHRLTTTQHSVAYQSTTIWNSLPIHIRDSPTLPILKRNIKQYFINSY